MSDTERLNMFIDVVLEHLDRNPGHEVGLLLAVTIDPETGGCGSMRKSPSRRTCGRRF